jgi:hypothetical protein
MLRAFAVGARKALLQPYTPLIEAGSPDRRMWGMRTGIMGRSFRECRTGSSGQCRNGSEERRRSASRDCAGRPSLDSKLRLPGAAEARISRQFLNPAQTVIDQYYKSADPKDCRQAKKQTHAYAPMTDFQLNARNW